MCQCVTVLLQCRGGGVVLLLVMVVVGGTLLVSERYSVWRGVDGDRISCRLRRLLFTRRPA